MGFSEAKRRLIECLEEGNFAHEERAEGYTKNYLKYGRISVETLTRFIARCRGGQHREGPHDFDRNVTVHEFFPRPREVDWYVKVYFDPDLDEAVMTAVFISVHPSGH